ncbi:MAG: thiolase family protein [Solirubrobacteraceae bacterium]
MGVAVVGIGTIGFGQMPEDSVASMADRAVAAALEDCGLERSAIDGLLVHIGSPRGLDYDEMATLLGLEVRYATQTWSHGRFGATVITTAAMALELGLIDCALCVGAFKNSPFTRVGTTAHGAFFEGMREGGGPHAETPWVGLAAPVAGAAMATRRYLHRFSVDREKLAAVPLAQRRAAERNELAVMRTRLTAEDYASSRPIVEPLRLHDCSAPVDTAIAVILTRADRAADLRARAVHLRGYQGLHAGPSEFIFGQPGLGVNQADVFDYAPLGAREPVFRRAGVTPADVQTLHCYDGFSPQVLWTLERFGFCAPGEAADWIAGGRIELGGELPVNTSGGHLSEGHSNGWGQTVEIVRQLRGEAGPRQIANLRVAQWATTLGDSIIYGTDPA